MKLFYLLMCIAGTLFPYGAFIPWLWENGLNLGLLFSEASQTRIGSFAWLDVVVSAIVLLVFIWTEGTRKSIKKLWLPTAGTCLVGVSLGLPLFLLLREIHCEKSTS